MSHTPRECPVWGKKCHKCGNKNHFSTQCRSKQSGAGNRKSHSTSRGHKGRGKPHHSRSRSKSVTKSAYSIESASFQDHSDDLHGENTDDLHGESADLHGNQRNLHGESADLHGNQRGNLHGESVDLHGNQRGDLHGTNSFQDHQESTDFLKQSFSTISRSKLVASISNDTDPEGKTKILTVLQLKFPHHNGLDNVTVKVDDGVEGNILPLNSFRAMFPHALDANGYQKPGFLRGSKTTLECYDDGKLINHGSIKLRLQHYSEKSFQDHSFYVVETKTPKPIIVGHPASIRLGLIWVLCKNISKSVLAIKKTENSSNNSFQDHQLNIDGKTPWKWQRSKSESSVHSFWDHLDDLHGENGKKCPDKDSFKTINQKSGKSVLSKPSTKCTKNGPKSGSFKTIKSQNGQIKGSFKTIEDGSKNDTSFKTIGENDQKSTSFKTIANRVKNLNPWYMVPIDEVSQVISNPKSRKKAQPVTEQPSSSPPPLGSRFNPIYVKSGSVSIDSTRDLQALFPNSFDCIGDMQGEYDIKTDLTIPSVQHRRWKVPIEYKEGIEKELAEMVQQKIIIKQTEPTPWVSSLTYPKKANGKLRICLDPKDLNKAIIHENHKAPTLEKIAHVLTGATKFSKVDGNKAFFGMHLTEEASLLTMFNTHLGRYRFLHVPFGLKMSQDIFQMRMDDIVAQCPSVLAIHDDVFIYGKHDRDHTANIINLFNVAQKEGLIFNSKKCAIKQESIMFFGRVFSAEGYSPDPEKIQGISKMTPPQTKQELQSFLGVVNYLQTFIPHLSLNTEPLWALLKKENCFAWDESTNMCFQKIKSQLQKALLRPLRYYDQSKPVTLQCDASLKGLGACIIQGGQPIAFVNKSLMDTETHYANIKRELLAIIYGCEKFHTYLYGRTLIMEMDHKPLKMISLKNITVAPACLQRMLLHLQYDLVITYWPGREILLADALSCLPSRTNTEIKLDLWVDAISMFAFTLRCLTKIGAETQWDPILLMVHRLTLNSWPDRQGCVPRAARFYWSIHDELSIDGDILTKGEWVVIPLSCRDNIMADLHGSHASINKAMDLARTCVYWPSMEADVTNYIRWCLTCIECSNLPVKMLKPHEVPPGPWVKIGVDFFQDHLGKKHLIVADYFSKFPYMFPVASAHHFKTITHLRELFAAEGIPAIVMSDNGPPFNGEEFRQFAHDFDFVHTTLSPHFHQSNGFIKAMVKKVKNAYKKTDGSPRLEHYFSYVTHPSWQTSCPQQRFYMVIPLKEQSSQDHPKESIYVRSSRDSLNFKKNKKKTLTKPTEPKIYAFSKSRNKSSSFKTNKAQALLSGQLVQWLKYWNVDDPTWSRAPTAESTEEIELIWSPYVTIAPPFKTIQWKKERNSPKTFPFKTISPARPNPCLSRRKPDIWTPDPCCLMNLTHIKHPHHHPWGATHLDHCHAHPQHHFHPENHLWSPVQRTPHLKVGRDTSLNQLSSNPMTLTKDSHMDFQPC